MHVFAMFAHDACQNKNRDHHEERLLEDFLYNESLLDLEGALGCFAHNKDNKEKEEHNEGGTLQNVIDDEFFSADWLVQFHVPVSMVLLSMVLPPSSSLVVAGIWVAGTLDNHLSSLSCGLVGIDRPENSKESKKSEND